MSLEGFQLDRYHLQKKIGGGGGGEVYRANDTYMSIVGREVAVKVITFPDESEQVRLARTFFLREVQAISQLNHPHIIPIFDYGYEPRTKLAYIVMPFCQQGSLASWWQKRHLSPQTVMHFLHQASDALQQAHDQKIIHKDVKPQNFLLRENIDNPRLPDLMLTDFGIAKLHTETISPGNLPIGTMYYMAPEQWDRHPVYASDQYSLAIMAYELLTEQLPFRGNSLEELVEKHHTSQPDPPSMLNSSIPIAIDKVILRALAKNPENRYPSITEFAQDFEQAVFSQEKGENVDTFLFISEADAQSGGEYILPLPQGIVSSGEERIRIKVPSGTRHGNKMFYQGRGKPSRGTRGSLVVTIGIRPNSGFENETQEINHKIRSIKNLIGLASATLGIILIIISGLFYVSSCSSYNNIIDQVGLARKAAINSMTSSSPVLSDPFYNDNKQYKWDTTNNCLFTNGFYTVMQSPGYLTTCNAEATNFSNFVYQVTFTIVHGDCGGISFRAQNHTNFYFLEICQNGDHKGQYRFAIVRDGNENDKIGFTQSPAIHTGINQPNTIAVIANGSAFVIKVNYHEVDTASDGTFSDGKIGVFVDAQQQLVEFSNAQVWNL